MSDYDEKLNLQARKLISIPSLELGDVRELLILSAAMSCHVAHTYFDTHREDRILIEHLMDTIRDEDGYCSGDARIQAAFYLSKFTVNLIRDNEKEVLSLYKNECGEGEGGCLRPLLALALGRIRSDEGLDRILHDLESGYDSALFREALDMYDTANTSQGTPESETER